MAKLTHSVSSFALIGVTLRENKEVRPKGVVFYHLGVEVWSRFKRQAMLERHKVLRWRDSGWRAMLNMQPRENS